MTNVRFSGHNGFNANYQEEIKGLQEGGVTKISSTHNSKEQIQLQLYNCYAMQSVYVHTQEYKVRPAGPGSFVHRRGDDQVAYAKCIAKYLNN